VNKWKIAFLITVPILLVSNIFFIYMVIDTGISYSYLQDSFKHHSQSESALGKLIVEGSKNYSQKDILHLLRQAKPEEFIVEEDNKIFYSGNTFIFENDRLVKIQ
jgi:hypothetical protein